jgi:hypothetical protein
LLDPIQKKLKIFEPYLAGKSYQEFLLAKLEEENVVSTIDEEK